jgi:hypothetical protein
MVGLRELIGDFDSKPLAGRSRARAHHHDRMKKWVNNFAVTLAACQNEK